jgi:hypothetical protein
MILYYYENDQQTRFLKFLSYFFLFAMLVCRITQGENTSDRFYEVAIKGWYVHVHYVDLFHFYCLFFFCFFLEFGPGKRTCFNFILSYEAGFYKPTILKLHPPLCRITAHATVPCYFSTILSCHAF